MRFMGQAKHIGKVVVSMEDPEIVVAATNRTGALFRRDATYLITGGLGGFGLAVANWMAREGARNFALVGRSGARADAEARVQELRNRAVRVEVIRADVSRTADVRRALAEVRATMPPLGGIFHAAMVLGDTPIVDLDRERMERVMAPKMIGAWRLHCETLDDDLDCFVLFSSITSMFGNPLQANYAAANSYIDALAHRRRAMGKPALSINWGAVSKVGYVSRHKEVSDYLEWLGWHAFSPSQAFEVLGGLLRRDATHVMAARVDWKRWAESSPAAVASAMLRHFAPAADASAAQRAETGSPRAAILAAAAPDRRGLVISFLKEKVGKVLGHSPSKLDVERPLNDLGFDSLIAVELMTILRMELGVELAAVKLLQGVTIDGIATLALEQLGAGAPAMEAPLKPVPKTAEENTASAIVNAEPVMTAPVEEPVKPPAPPSSLYATLDYSRWTGSQRAMCGVVTAAMRALTRMKVEGLENLPRSGGCVLAINHLSLADTPLVLAVLPRRTIMLASDHLRSSTFLNWFLHDIGNAIYVRRGEGDEVALANGLAVLRAGGMLGLGPEGTRSRNGALARGRTGVAYLATQADVPVIPLAAWGQEQMPRHWKSMRRAPISVRIGHPIQFASNGTPPDAVRLREYTDQVMKAIEGWGPFSLWRSRGGQSAEMRHHLLCERAQRSQHNLLRHCSHLHHEDQLIHACCREA
jgi:1-acyl-sn-glycerol-3-phosphate acyltransferase